MNEQLIIENFGPIQQATIMPSDLTIFLGPQATGKSLATQLLYFFRNIESLTVSPLPPDLSPLHSVLGALEKWIGNKISVYASSGTKLCWELAGLKYEIVWEGLQPKLNDVLTQRVTTLSSAHTPNKTQIYLPSGRALYSFLPSYSLASRQLASEQWPDYILGFYQRLGNAMDKLWRHQEQGNNDFGQSPEASFLKPRMDSIMKGEIRYGPDGILLKVGEKHLLSTTMAAGQMEIWPFWAIIASLFTPKFSPGPSHEIYFEEPEAHLHPQAQNTLMEVIAYLIQQRDMRFLLTTHSPYILYAVNNFLMAQQVLDATGALPTDISSQVALRPTQAAAYRFSSAGKVENIVDGEVNLIDETELNNVANDQIELFSQLQASLEEAE